MYNDIFDASNKIITADDIIEIISAMNEKLLYYQKIFQKETAQNNMLEYKYQTWTFEDTGSNLYLHIDFYDNTNISFDSYGSFINAFNTRLRDIKGVSVIFSLKYFSSNDVGQKHLYSQQVAMFVRETKISFKVELLNNDKKMDDIYELIRSKILNAPEKYDNVVKKRNTYKTVVGLAIGFIPAIIITTLLLFIEQVRPFFLQYYALYPICCIVLACFISNIAGPSILDGLYVNIVPDKKYAGYDRENFKSIYKDDIDKYTSTAEILIGRNANNLRDRQKITDIYNKFKRWLPYEIGAVVLLSLAIIIISKIF